MRQELLSAQGTREMPTQILSGAENPVKQKCLENTSAVAEVDKEEMEPQETHGQLSGG